MTKADFKARAQALKRDIPAVAHALTHRRTPWYAKALAAAALVYALSPIDLIPDFVPVLGYLDDLIILPTLIALTLRCLPQDVIVECRAAQETSPQKRWYFALPFVAVWLLAIWLIIRWFI